MKDTFWGPGRIAAFLLTTMTLLDGAGFNARAATDIVNNLGEARVSAKTFDSAFPNQLGAQAFTTDNRFYTLNSVTVELHHTSGGSSMADVTLRADSAGSPGAIIENLGTQTFSAMSDTAYQRNSMSNPLLEPNTQYWVVVGYVSGDFEFNYAAGTTASGPGSLGLDRVSQNGSTFGSDSTESFKIAVNGTLTKVNPIITWGNPADITEGTPLSATQLNASANVAGNFVYSPVSGTMLGVGNNQNLDVTFTPTDTVNYNVVMAQVQINVLPPPAGTQVSLDGSNNLLVTDVAAGGKNDTLHISRDLANNRIVITDPANSLSTSVGTLAAPNTVHVPDSARPIIVDAGAGDDTLTLDFSPGNFIRTVEFRAGSGATDILILQGGGSFSTVEHTSSAAANEGSVSVTGNTGFSYTGVDQIMDNLTAGTRNFNYDAGADQITLDSFPGFPRNVITSVAAGETVAFPNPTSQLTIRTGDGNDNVTVNGVDAGFGGAFSIIGEGGSDTLLLAGAPLNVTSFSASFELIQLGNGSIATASTQHYTGNVILMSDMTLECLGDELSISGTIDGPGGLTLNSSVQTLLMDSIGATTPLQHLQTDTGGFTFITGIVTTIGGQTYHDAVILINSTTITGSNIAFNNMVDGGAPGAQGLIVNGSMTTFAGSVGSSTSLLQLITDAAGTTIISGPSVTTSGGGMIFNDSVVIGANTTLTGAGVAFNNTVDGSTPGTESLTVITSGGGLATFGDGVGDDQIGATTALGSLLTVSDAGTLIKAASVTTAGNQTFNKPVILGTSGTGNPTTTFTGGFVYFVETLDATTPGVESIVVNAAAGNGQTYFGGSVGSIAALDSITTDAAGKTFFSAGPGNLPTSVTTTGPQTYNDQVDLLGHATFNSGNGPISFPGGIDSGYMPGQNLTVNTAGATELFNVGANLPLTSVTTDAPGVTTIDAAFMNLGGLTIFNDPVLLKQSTTFVQSGMGDLVFESSLDSDGAPRDALFSVPSPHAVFLGGEVGGVLPLNSLNGTASFIVAGSAVRTLMDQTYNGPIYFDESSSLVTEGSSVFFNGTVNVAENAHIVVNTGAGAGDINLPGNIFGTAGGVRETLTLRTGLGVATIQGVVAPTIRVIVERAPVIVTQPKGKTIASGKSITLSVAAIGTAPFNYQWRKNDAPLGGEINPTLTLTSVQLTDSGAYSVIVSNDAGQATSASATLTVLTPPTISIQPMSQSVAFGANVSLGVTAAGSPTLRYQWRFNGVNIPGATMSALNINDVRAANLGRYSVIVQNDVGALTSDRAELSVSLPALGVAQTPDTAPTQTDASGTKSVLIPDSATYFMRWRAPGNGIATFDTRGSAYDTRMTVYEGGTLANLQQIASDDDSGGFLTSEVRFNVIANATYTIAIDGVEGAFGLLVLNWSLEITTEEAPIIMVQPESLSAQFGGMATLSVQAAGSDPLAYQWRHNGMDVPGANGSSITVIAIQPSDLGQYVVVVSNGAGTVRSHPAHIDVGPVPTAISRSKFEELSPGGGAAPQSGHGRRHNIPVAAGVLGTQVINNTGSVTEAGEPNHGNAIGGSSRWFELIADADGTMLVDTLGSDIDTTLAVYTGATLSTLTLVAQDNDGAPDGIRSLIQFDAVAGTKYTVAVDGVNGAAGIINLNWLLGDVPVITSAPVDLLVDRLGDAAFSVTATGNPAPDFSWSLNGMELAGKTDAALTLADVATSDAGIYTVTASNALGSASANVLLVINDPLRFEGNSRLQPDGSFTLTLVGPVNNAFGISIALEASPDFVTWTQVATATSMNGMFELMEANAADKGANQRYYRVKLVTGQ